MLSSFICGSGSFHKDETTTTTTPKRSSRKNSFSRRLSIKNSFKNPYSSLGLDKLSSLIADLEDKTQKIYSQLVVRLKKDQNKIRKVHQSKKEDQERPQTEPRPAQEVVKEPTLDQEPKRVAAKRGFSWNEEAWRTSFYLPAALILILVFLAVFGRSAAVMCTSVGWYLVPVLRGERSNYGKRSMKRKELGSRLSEKKMVVKSL